MSGQPDHELEVLEDDETIPPRPEEAIANAVRDSSPEEAIADAVRDSSPEAARPGG